MDIPIHSIELMTYDILQQAFLDIKKLRRRMKKILRSSSDEKHSEYEEALEKIKKLKKEVGKVESSVEVLSRTYK